ncbi:MAG: M23 family metallopeptidase [Rhodovibrionaceae bacterium]
MSDDSLQATDSQQSTAAISKSKLGLTCAMLALTALLGVTALQSVHEPAAAGPLNKDDNPAENAAQTADATQQALVEPRDPGAYRIVHLESESQDASPQDAFTQPVTLSLEVKPGDTLMALLASAGVQSREAYAAIEAMEDVFSPRDLRPGQEIAVSLLPRHPLDGPGPDFLQALHLRPSLEQDIEIVRQSFSKDENVSFAALTVERPLEEQEHLGLGTIDTSLYQAAADAGVPNQILMEMIRAYSFDVDFQRDIQPGDSFELVYETFVDEDGQLARSGEILYAELVLSGKELRFYHYTPSSGFTDYFNDKGQSVRKTLMRTPIDGARISSGYGMRHHPVLGYSKMHKGVDFAAPTGTPIYAAGDGVVQRANRFGGYGNYIRIRHNGTYDTAYAHLNGFAKGIKAGARVRQGDVIGYVGTTGRSTGPHLHYEVMENGGQTNPASIKLPAGEKLAGADLANFQQARAEIDSLRTALRRTQTQLVRMPSCSPAADGTADC